MESLFIESSELERLISQLTNNIPELFLFLCVINFTHRVKTKSYTTTYLLIGGYISIANICFQIFNFTYGGYYSSLNLGMIVSYILYTGKYILIFGVILLLFELIQVKLKQSIFICFLLSIVSMGIFASYWHIKMRKISNVKPIPTIILTGFILFSILSVIGLLHAGSSNTEEMLTFYFFRTGAYITHLILIFKMRKNLLNKYPCIEGISGVLSFFFGMFYLQYIINKHEQYLTEELAKD